MKQQPKGKPKPGPKLERATSEVLYGLRAGLAVLERRPDDLLSVSFSRDLKREMEPMLRACAAKRLSCQEVPEDELTRLSGSRNHEGLVIEVKPRVWLGLNDLGDWCPTSVLGAFACWSGFWRRWRRVSDSCHRGLYRCG